jgi:SAM-dependent methyltransferase
MPSVAGTAVTLADGATLRSAEFAIVDELRLWGGEQLLFVECGDGWAAEEAWRRMGKGCVCGVDRSSKLIARAARLREVPGKLEFQTWDGRHLPHPDGRFDSVVFQSDVRRWPQPVSVLRELCRVVRGGGEVYLVDSDGGVGAEPPSDTPEWPLLLAQAGLRHYGAQTRSRPKHDADDAGTSRILCARAAAASAE